MGPTLQDEPRFKVILTSPIIPDPMDLDTNPSIHPLATTAKPPTTTSVAARKKGTAATVKRTSRRGGKSGSRAPRRQTIKPAKTSRANSLGGNDSDDENDEGDGDEEGDSDSGPYCLCRGPDDHRWMIQCEGCDDWFHGECVDLDKGVGECLIDRFICPNCVDPSINLVTRYKRTCSLKGCYQPARMYGSADDEDEEEENKEGEGVSDDPTKSSVFCSQEHCTQWWEGVVKSLPKKVQLARGGGILRDDLTQEDLMALLSGTLSGIDPESGEWRLLNPPFSNSNHNRQLKPSPGDDPNREINGGDDDDDDDDDEANVLGASSDATDITQIVGLTDEERDLLAQLRTDRVAIAEQIVLCQKMLRLLDMAYERRRAAVSVKAITEDICGYDALLLDGVGTQAAFAAFLASPEGENAFAAKDPERGSTGGMCERKRCKAHSGWHGMLVKTVRRQMRELTALAEEKLGVARVVQTAASERELRKRAEMNWVETVPLSDGDDEEEGERVGGR